MPENYGQGLYINVYVEERGSSRRFNNSEIIEWKKCRPNEVYKGIRALQRVDRRTQSCEKRNPLKVYVLYI